MSAEAKLFLAIVVLIVGVIGTMLYARRRDELTRISMERKLTPAEQYEEGKVGVGGVWPYIFACAGIFGFVSILAFGCEVLTD